MSIILLIITLLFQSNTNYTVSALTNEDLSLHHNFIEKFDIINSHDLYWPVNRPTRQVATSTGNGGGEYRRLEFHSLGRKFRLIFNRRPANLVTEDFTISSIDGDGNISKVRYNISDNVLDGQLEDEPNSRATLAYVPADKKSGRTGRMIQGQISMKSGNIMIEPAYLHQDNLNRELYNDSMMLVYRLEDYKHQLDDLGTLCDGLKLNETTKTTTNTATSSIRNDNLRNSAKRSIEDVAHPKDKTRCTLHLVADFLFYKNVGKGDMQSTVTYLLALINRVNQIYLPTEWETGDDNVPPFSNVGFSVQNITIHQEYTRKNELHYNMKSDRVWGAREFLDNFSRFSPQNHFCLAHLLTYRKFDSPVLGLAYVAAPRFGQIGGICSKPQLKPDGLVYKHNTGISTSQGINGGTLITRQADLVLAHELGHNLGAEHDTSDCRPESTSGGAFLMHPFAVLGFERNNRFLSNCSRLSIGRVLRNKAPSCFLEVVDHICGNGIVEDDEECDGGSIGLGPSDPCCDETCHFTAGSQCSDRHSWCCGQCKIRQAGYPCREAEKLSCRGSSLCDGQSAECPASPPVEDDTSCVARGLCRGGDCKPFCEARELISCLCQEPRNACKLCCKTSANSTCVPYDERADPLEDGVMCYNGVCEKGRCEQPIQDVISRLWDVVEDINFTSFVKFLRDNIVIVIIIVTIPLWCIAGHYINEFDRRIKGDVMTAIANYRVKNNRRHHPSPFLPRLFVADDDISNNGSIGNSTEDVAGGGGNGDRLEEIHLRGPEVTSV